MRLRLHPRFLSLRPAVLLCFALGLAGCGGLRNEGAALGLVSPAAPAAALKPTPEAAYADGRAAAARGDYESAERMFITAAEAGSLDARLALGAMYLSGTGVNQDNAEALHWLEPAARAGNAEAQARVGLIYEIGGIGVNRNPTAALSWYERAAGQGNASAQYRAGHLLTQAILGHEDPARAMRLFQAAAAQNHPQAQTAVGTLYLQGRGVRQDTAQGIVWLKRAAANNDPDAMLQLGRLYWEGQQVAKNIPEGTMWLQRAASLGSEEARHELALPPG